MSHCSEYIWKIYYELSQFNLNQSLTLKITSLSPCNKTIKIYEKFIHILLNYSATKKNKKHGSKHYPWCISLRRWIVFIVAQDVTVLIAVSSLHADASNTQWLMRFVVCRCRQLFINNVDDNCGAVPSVTRKLHN